MFDGEQVEPTLKNPDAPPSGKARVSDEESTWNGIINETGYT